ncbi:MAG: asparagine synthase (glutamine-hydrolyzing) [Planctomycetes bacterium]|nr:asparagine synthase (glutamine-hydrolyzing) [Planctomycetota bacterium]
MCGIVGIASQKMKIDTKLLSIMRDTMRHRGPDDAGLWFDPKGCVGLAHRRLSIIDLSKTGHQPMTEIHDQFCIVFNGEIYNYRRLRDKLISMGLSFRTNSDTEIILQAYQAWGENCLERLNGMFAFALYDKSKKQLFIVRDRTGQKPLFYYHSNGRLAFASELKALMADPAFPRELDIKALNFYLAYGYIPGNMCILKGVHKLPPGHMMTYNVETDQLIIRQYWRLPTFIETNATDISELASRFHELLRDSVRLRLSADVPVGILLSGGIDSSLVTAMAVEVASKPIKTFTISFPGHDKYDERPYARLVASHFGTDHTELEMEPTSKDVLSDLAKQYDEPIADSSMVPTYLISRLIRQHATVALGGDGGDELFGGYPHHCWVQHQNRLRYLAPPPLRPLMRKAAGKLLPPGLKGRNYILGCLSELPYSIAQVNTYFDAGMRQRLLAPVWSEANLGETSPESYKAALCDSTGTPLQMATSVDFLTFLPEDILVKVDRASMLTSLEIRSPYLDHRIVDFAFRQVPDKFRATLRKRKILPCHFAKGLLPKQLDLKRKQGFTMPLHQWFKGSWGTYFEQVLQEADSSLFDQKVIRQLINYQRWGFLNSQRLFALVIFELWRRNYGIQLN